MTEHLFPSPQPGGCADPPIFLGASKACSAAPAFGAFPADSANYATIWKLVGPPDLPSPPTELSVVWEAGRPEAAAARVRTGGLPCLLGAGVGHLPCLSAPAAQQWHAPSQCAGRIGAGASCASC